MGPSKGRFLNIALSAPKIDLTCHLFNDGPQQCHNGGPFPHLRISASEVFVVKPMAETAATTTGGNDAKKRNSKRRKRTSKKSKLSNDDHLESKNSKPKPNPKTKLNPKPTSQPALAP